MTTNPNLYAILDLGYVSEADAVPTTNALLAGGADLLQLRAKNHDLATIRRVAEKLIPLCRAAGVPFILNDFPALAAELDADGVHLGQDDGPLANARRAFECGMRSAECGAIEWGLRSAECGVEEIEESSASLSLSFTPHSALETPHSKLRTPHLFGRSTHSLDQARAALAEGFDYIGFGPLFPTPTKAGRPAIGLQDIAVMERDVGSKIPAFCIGGIKRDNLPQVLAAGARRVVIVSDLLTAQNVQAATAVIKAALSAEFGVRSAE